MLPRQPIKGLSGILPNDTMTAAPPELQNVSWTLTCLLRRKFKAKDIVLEMELD